MATESFTCNLYKIVETSSKSFTFMINVVSESHKKEIIKKLRKLGHTVSSKSVNNKLVKMELTNIDYIKGDEIC